MAHETLPALPVLTDLAPSISKRLPTWIRSLLIAFALLFAAVGVTVIGPWHLNDATHVYLSALLPEEAWGVILILAGMGLLGSAVANHRTVTRVALAVASLINAAFAAAMWIGWVQDGTQWAPVLPWFPSLVPVFMLIIASAPLINEEELL